MRRSILAVRLRRVAASADPREPEHLGVAAAWEARGWPTTRRDLEPHPTAVDERADAVAVRLPRRLCGSVSEGNVVQWLHGLPPLERNHEGEEVWAAWDSTHRGFGLGRARRPRVAPPRRGASFVAGVLHLDFPAALRPTDFNVVFLQGRTLQLHLHTVDPNARAHLLLPRRLGAWRTLWLDGDRDFVVESSDGEFLEVIRGGAPVAIEYWPPRARWERT